MKATTFICPPHSGHANGSNSYTRLINMAHVALLRADVRCSPDAASDGSETRLFRRPRLLLGESDESPWEECAA